MSNKENVTDKSKDIFQILQEIQINQLQKPTSSSSLPQTQIIDLIEKSTTIFGKQIKEEFNSVKRKIDKCECFEIYKNTLKNTTKTNEYTEYSNHPDYSILQRPPLIGYGKKTLDKGKHII
jgi:hypothetical protein